MRQPQSRFYSYHFPSLWDFACVINPSSKPITQGLINSLIFYANVIQTYKGILYSTTNVSYYQLVLHVFIAWFNLDFGIKTCIGMNLNMFWKTWMQFLFPLYIWAIAGLIIKFCYVAIQFASQNQLVTGQYLCQLHSFFSLI